MPENPLEKLLHDIAEMHSKIESHMYKRMVITPEIKARLENLIQVFERFSESNNLEIEKAGIKIATLRKLIETLPPTLDPNIKKTLEFSKRLKQEVEETKLKITMESQIPDKNEVETEASRKNKVKKRQNKFKRVGGNQNWLPM